MLSIDFISDALIAIAFVIIPVSFFFAISRQERLNRQIKIASVCYAIGMLSVAFSFLTPHIWPAINGTVLELVLKLFSAAAILAASLMSWPVIRAAIRHTRLLASVTDTELLLLERDDLATAKTELEKQIITSAYELEHVNRQMRLALLNSPITMFRQDKDLRYTWIFNLPEPLKESDFIGRTDEEVFPDEVALTVGEVKRVAMEIEEEQSTEVRVHFPHGAFWYILRTQPDYDVDGRILGTLSCAIDITGQKHQQQRLVLLMREVTHRSKKLLAVLQSIMRQTALRARTVDDFFMRLTERMRSMARSHDLLVNDDWNGTSLKKLLESQLGLFSDVDADRIHIEGSDMLLTAFAVQNLGLAFHELSANASQYGSLSGDHGVVLVDCSIVAGDHDRDERGSRQLKLVWTESCGPTVDPPSEKCGFGHMLLERVVGQGLGGSVDMDFAPQGLICRMHLPVARIAAANE